jgi:cytochrome d ubiquinol oxidase subunit I
MHWFAILMVAVGATISAFWIIVANSWQQTPAGHVFNEATGRAELASFWEAVFNPSTLLRFHPTLFASFVAGAFFMAAVCAYLLRKDSASKAARGPMKVATVFGLISTLLVIYPTGHEHAQQVARTQPEKFAAIEGLYETQTNAPLVVFGLVYTRPPELKAKVHLPITGLLGRLAFADPNAEIKGIDSFPPDEVPPLWLPFVSFHNMVILGMIMVVLMLWAVIQLARGRLWRSRRFLRLLIWSLPLPLAACQFGWVAAEVGRQPWIVYKLLRTRDAVSVTLSAGEVWFSLVLFTTIYLALLALYLFLLVREAKHGPQPIDAKGGVA